MATHRPIIETIRLEDMRLFAAVAGALSFTAAASACGVPKQTLSRRIATLERALGARLLHRSTRRLKLTEAGADYARRCAEIARLAAEANRAVTETQEVPAGTLRITADPVFGEAFLPGLVFEYARRWPQVRFDVVLTRRKVDLIEEGFDAAFRIGAVDSPELAGFSLGPARVRYCASPSYVKRMGAPARPEALAKHECVCVVTEGVPPRWPFRGPKGLQLVPVSGRLALSSFTMARAAVLEGFGIGIFPELTCEEDLRRKRLVTVLDAWTVEVGGIWLLHAAGRLLPARVRTFLTLARERLRPATRGTRP
jgi:DNA-binding transcriptional LysR family regulator